MASPFVTHSGFDPQLWTELIPPVGVWTEIQLSLSLVFLGQVSQDKEISDLSETNKIK